MSGFSQVPQSCRMEAQTIEERAHCGFGKDSDCVFVLCKVR